MLFFVQNLTPLPISFKTIFVKDQYLLVCYFNSFLVYFFESTSAVSLTSSDLVI